MANGKVIDLSKCGGVCKGSCKHYEIGVECPPEATYEPVKLKPMALDDVKEWMRITEGKGGIGRRDLMEWLIAEVERRDSAQKAQDMLLEVVKLAYRKHHMDDPAIGWEELDTKLFDALCNVMGDGNFNKWLKSV